MQDLPAVTDEAHTPPPWAVLEYAPECIRGDGAKKGPIALCRLSPSKACDIANAALIVTAVNERPALLRRVAELEAVLRKCRDELELVKDGSTRGVPHAVMALIPEAIEIADAALSTTERGGS